jgi:DsbC/DsbD-like thiol-disulfide interchange protein
MMVRPIPAPACLLAVVLAAFAARGAPLAAQVRPGESGGSEQVRARLEASVTALAPGSPFLVALDLEVGRGWYIYGPEPGDAGLPTTLLFRLPRGFRVASVRWPDAQMRVLAGGTAHVYTGRVRVIAEVVPPHDAHGRAVVAADAEWAACADVCLPQRVSLALALPVRAEPRANRRWPGRPLPVR